MNPIQDPILCVLEKPYSRWDSSSKKDLLRQGKPIPSLTCLTCLTNDKKAGKVFSKSFSLTWYKQHSWLCGSYYLQKLFCWPCVILGKTKSVWTTDGYCDFKNLPRSVQSHEESKEYIHNYLNFKNLEKNCATIVDVLNDHCKLLKKQCNESVRLNRLIMEHLIDLVLILGQQDLAFRGYDESSSSLNKGNFKELFDMHLRRCSLEVRNFLSIQNKFSGNSKVYKTI